MAEVAAQPNGGPSKVQRGAVEEVISKRLKALTKKIIRIQGYRTQTDKSLNADQRSALASLPALEAVAKELEDLIKPGGPVETAELSQAGVLRETRETAAAQAISIAQLQLTEYSESLSRRISQLLRLHSILHPARNASYDGDVGTSSRVASRATPADVDRVHQMYHDLQSGGEAGQKVLQQLGGKAGTNEVEAEDLHIFELMDSLDEPSPEISSSPSAGQGEDGGFESLVQPQFGTITPEEQIIDVHRVQRTRQPTDQSMLTKMSDDDLPLGASAGDYKVVVKTIAPLVKGPEDKIQPAAPLPMKPAAPLSPAPAAGPALAPSSSSGATAGAGDADPTAKTSINFLQFDELITEPVDSKGPTVTTSADDAQVTTARREPDQEPTALNPPPTNSSSKIDWTADDIDDEEPIFGTNGTSSTPAHIITPHQEKPTDEVVGQRTKADESSALHEQHGDAPMLGSPLEIPSINGDTGSSSNLKKGRSGGNGRGRGRGRNQTQTREQQQQQQQQPRSQAAQHMLDLRKGVLVDDDGFEKLVKKQAPSQPQGQAGRGRGGGQRSRGDRGRGPPKNPSQSDKPATNGQPQSKPQQKRHQSKPVVKPSLYKTDIVKP